MTLGLHDNDRRHRRRLWVSILRLGLYAGLLAGTGAFAYQIGVEQMKARTDLLEERLAELEILNARLEQNAVILQAATRTAEQRLTMLQGDVRVERSQAPDLPPQIAETVARRLADGLTAERMAGILDVIPVERDCTEPSSRRFIMPLGPGGGPSGAVAFVDGLITVTGQGSPARSATGGPQAWFDPQQPVTVRFLVRDGATEEVSGTLPLTHALIQGDQEFRFTVTEGDRSLVVVTMDRCPFP